MESIRLIAVTVSFNTWMLYGSDMTLMTTDALLLYYHMNAVWLTFLDIVIFKVLHDCKSTDLGHIPLFLDVVIVTGPFDCRYEKVGYSFDGLPCYCSVVIFDLLNYL